MQIEYLTTNRNKFAEACHILANWQLVQLNIELPEIQGTATEVIKAKAEMAYARENRPLIVEDVSFCCPALGGLPGPYIKDFLLCMGARGLYELIHKYDDHTVEVVCSVAYIENPASLTLFEGRQKGRIVAPRSLDPHHCHGWNGIVQPEGQELTFGEMTLQQRSGLSMRFLALSKLDQFLREKALLDIYDK